VPGVGSVIDGRYQVEDLLGEGGMGVVMRARHRFTGAVVALKMLHPHLRLRPDLAARFLVEARAPAAIGHPGIVGVLDGGVTPEGDPYFAMELLNGEPLQQLMRREALSFEAARHICLEILDALAAAHSAGFIHRDLKPENVFVQRPSSAIKLLDFGITKSLVDAEESSTRTGATMGTLLYMSPEQLRNAKRVDHRTDLWAVGVMLQQMLTGDLPYRAESVGDMLMLVLTHPPQPLASRLADVPPELETFMQRALAVDPAYRFQSAQEMAQAIAALPSLALHRGASYAAHPVAHVPVPPTLTAAPAYTAVPTSVGEPALAPGAARSPNRMIAFALAGMGLLAVVVVGTLVVSGLGGWLMFSKRQTNAFTAGCERACTAMLGCGLPGNLDECVTDCQSNPQQGACMTNAGSDCNAVGACYIEKFCGKKPAGNASCRETQECETSCSPTDVSCNCACLGAASPNAAAKISINNACALRHCEDECVGTGATRARCNDCAVRRCVREVSQCSADGPAQSDPPPTSTPAPAPAPKQKQQAPVAPPQADPPDPPEDPNAGT
jgi:serine/threonine-protein kinase